MCEMWMECGLGPEQQSESEGAKDDRYFMKVT